MNLFLIKILILGSFFLAVNLVFISFANGFTDAYYMKLSSPKYSSLILGASRANEGIMPSVMNISSLSQSGKVKIYNYAFSNSDSPYGAVYLNAIKQKITEKKNGVFILSVHPWSVSVLDELESEDNLLEERLTLGKVSSYSGKPNYSYFYKAYEYGTGNILLKELEYKISTYLNKSKGVTSGGTIEVYKDGWLENSYFNMDSIAVLKRMQVKVNQLYSNDANNKYKYSYSVVRKLYLEKTVQYLKQFGSVYLVRMPVDKYVTEVENDYFPSFDSLIFSIAEQNNIEYIKSYKEYSYSDGHHLDKKSAIEYSKELANIIDLK